MRVLALFFGPLAAILIGVEAGTGDASAGVFRDLVVTGRSRLALFASRVPAALALCWLVITGVAYAMLADRHVRARRRTCPRPDGALVLNGLRLHAALDRRAVRGGRGLRLAHDLQPGAIIALIGWQLVASP